MREITFGDWMEKQQNRSDCVGFVARALFRCERGVHFANLLDEPFLAALRVARAEFYMDREAEAIAVIDGELYVKVAIA